MGVDFHSVAESTRYLHSPTVALSAEILLSKFIIKLLHCKSLYIGGSCIVYLKCFVATRIESPRVRHYAQGDYL